MLTTVNRARDALSSPFSTSSASPWASLLRRVPRAPALGRRRVTGSVVAVTVLCSVAPGLVSAPVEAAIPDANPSFGTASVVWSPIGHSILRVSRSYGRGGSEGARLSGGDAGTVGLRNSAASRRLTVQPGQRETVSAWVRSTSPHHSGSVTVRIGRGDAAAARHVTRFRLDSAAWHLVRSSVVSPQAGSVVRVALRVGQVSVGEYVLVDDVALSSAPAPVSTPPLQPAPTDPSPLPTPTTTTTPVTATPTPTPVSVKPAVVTPQPKPAPVTVKPSVVTAKPKPAPVTTKPKPAPVTTKPKPVSPAAPKPVVTSAATATSTTLLSATFNGIGLGVLSPTVFQRVIGGGSSSPIGFDDSSLVSDGKGGGAVRTLLTAGTIRSSPGNNGIVDFVALKRQVSNACISYDVRFDSGFDWSLGGKLPGLLGVAPGVSPSTPTGGNYAGSSGWSGRLMWLGPAAYSHVKPRTNEIASYMYHPGQVDNYGDNVWWNQGFTAGVWHNVKQCYVMNTVGKSNGVLQAWLDGTQRVNRSDYLYRTRTDVSISHLSWSIFRGGATTAWAGKHDDSIDVDNVLITTTG